MKKIFILMPVIAISLVFIGACAFFKPDFIEIGVPGSKPSSSELRRGRGGRTVLAVTKDIKEIRHGSFKFVDPFDPRIEIPVSRNSRNSAEWQTSLLLPRDYKFYCSALYTPVPEEFKDKFKKLEGLKEYYDRNFKDDPRVTSYESRPSTFNGVPALEYSMTAEYKDLSMTIKMRGFFLIDPNNPDFTFEIISCETYDSRLQRITDLEEITNKFLSSFRFVAPEIKDNI